MRARIAAAVIAGATLGIPTGASAQEKGVHLDPDSPAGKEYAVPIDRARREAAGPSGLSALARPGSRASVVPLFGQGIKPRARQKPARKARKRARTRASRSPVRRLPPPAAATPAVFTGASTAGWTEGLIAPIVLADGLLGLALGG